MKSNQSTQHHIHHHNLIPILLAALIPAVFMTWGGGQLLSAGTALSASAATISLPLETKTQGGATSAKAGLGDYGSFTGFYNREGDSTVNYSGYTRESFLFANEDGTFIRLEKQQYNGGPLIRETYSSSFQYMSGTTMEYPDGMTLFGGAYQGQDNYFLVFGHGNGQQSEDQIVYEIVKYDKAWNAAGKAVVRGNDVRTPFYGSNLRMTERDGFLYITTSSQRYDDHQVNQLITIQEASMEVVSFSSPQQHSMWISHDFNQFVQTDGDTLVYLDHSDGYPARGAILNIVGEDSHTINVMPWYAQDQIGQNDTHGTLGGLGVSSSHYLCVGSKAQNGSFNIWVSAVDKNTRQVSSNYVTNYASGEESFTRARTPQLVTLGQDRFMLLWETFTYHLNVDDYDSAEDEWSWNDIYEAYGTDHTTYVHYLLLDGTGQPVTQEHTFASCMSDCEPVVVNGYVTWYYTGSSIVNSNNPRKSLVKTAPVFVCVPTDGSAVQQAELPWFTVRVDGAGYTSDAYLATSVRNFSLSAYKQDDKEPAMFLVLSDHTTRIDRNYRAQGYGPVDAEVVLTQAVDFLHIEALYRSDTDRNGWYHTDDGTGYLFYYHNEKYQAGWYWINGDEYYFDADGVLAVNTVVDGRQVDSEGRAVARGTGAGFTDVPSTAFYHDAVQWAVQQGITSGKSQTTFAPNESCTRGQMVQFLYKLKKTPSVSGTLSFTDVSDTAYYHDAVLWAVQQGITSGKSQTTFAPNENCTRGQMVQFLYKLNGSPAVSGTLSFTDVSDTAFYHDAVLWAVQNGITGGKSADTFAPNERCTRGQMVQFLYKMSVR